MLDNKAKYYMRYHLHFQIRILICGLSDRASEKHACSLVAHPPKLVTVHIHEISRGVLGKPRLTKRVDCVRSGIYSISNHSKSRTSRVCHLDASSYLPKYHGHAGSRYIAVGR